MEISSNIFTWLGQKVILSIARDTTFQVEAERSLRESEEKFRNYIENSPNGIFIADFDGCIIEANRAAAETTRVSREDLMTLSLTDLVAEHDREQALAEFERVKQEGRGGGTLSFPRDDGSCSYWKVSAVRIASNRVIGFVSNITEVMRAEKAARENEEFIASLLKAVPTPVFFQDSQGRYRGCNQAYTRMTGKSSEELEGKTVFQVWPEEIAERYSQKDRELINGVCHTEHEEILLDRDGRTRSVLVNRDVIRDETGKVTGLIGAFRDITERKRYEETLKANEHQLRLLVENSLDVIWTMDLNMVFTYASPAVFEQTGFTPEEWTGTSLRDHCSEENFQRMQSKAKLAAMDHEHFSHVIFETAFYRKNGEEFNAEVTAKLVRDDSGKPVGFQGTTRDISQRKRAEEALKETDAYLQYLFNNVPAGILVIDSGTRRIIDANRYTCELIGLEKEEIVNRECSEFICIGDHDTCPVKNLNGAITSSEVMLRIADDSLIPVHKTVMAARLKQKDYFIELFSDISERKRAEEERRRLQHQLQQSQKMESIGTMAGGIAHDFNNLLTVINGYSQMVLNNMNPGDPHYDKLEQILHAGRSAGNLTSQLLAFSRKQLYSPEVVDLNSLIANMDKMIRRLIGEDIMISTILKDVPPVFVDRSQFEQVLMNLVVNARDAIHAAETPGLHGTILIETGELVLDSQFVEEHPGSSQGPHVFIAVSDNGTGIDEMNLTRIYEPFFTTKESHKGTGLGLSTVYGIVKQNQAYITVESSPGEGSTFLVYWPAAAVSSDISGDVEQGRPGSTGHESILLVEDNESVSSFAEEVLQSLGYAVYTAGNGRKALDLISCGALRCDLIVTDLIMPELGGKDFIEKALVLMPDVRVIFMSGYSDGQIVHDGMLDHGVNFLQKPFTIQELSTLVRKVLDGHDEVPESL